MTEKKTDLDSRQVQEIISSRNVQNLSGSLSAHFLIYTVKSNTESTAAVS